MAPARPGYARPGVSARVMRGVAMSIGALLVLCAGSARSADPVVVGAFAAGSLAQWQSRSFQGETQYRLVGSNDTRALEARCSDTASALLRRVDVDLSQTPILRWSWRVDHVHAGLDGTTRDGDDYAARVYVIHGGGVLSWNTRAVNYVWANTQPAGSTWPNAFTDQAMMVALESGAPADPQQWTEEAVNVRRDFKRYYGLDLKTLDAVAIMTDCDNAGRPARAFYRDIRFSGR